MPYPRATIPLSPSCQSAADKPALHFNFLHPLPELSAKVAREHVEKLEPYIITLSRRSNDLPAHSGSLDNKFLYEAIDPLDLQTWTGQHEKT